MFSFLKKGAGPKQDLTEVLRGDHFLVDVRTPEEFKSGTAEGAVNIPLDQVADRMNEFPTDQPIIVFCQSGGRSGSAMKTLQAAGFTNITNGGGVQAVKNAQKEV